MEKLLADQKKTALSKEKPKVIAFYLPQFHRVPENDEWWGEGFTDWVAARNAKPLFPGHYQPRIPAHDNYYDLMEKHTLEWQAKLARNAHIYGFCIYHYWFGDDRQILERPAENLLKWENIETNYCFCWANGSWITSWSKIREKGARAWIDFENEKAGTKTKGMLLRQKYGGQEEWIKHFMYLLPFFRDKRYIKKDNKPVFMIYKPRLIASLDKMAEVWNRLAIENGFSGIYFIYANTEGTEDKDEAKNAVVRFEPAYTIARLYRQRDNMHARLCKKLKLKIPYFANYDRIWREILKNNRKMGNNVYPTALIDYDCTPRRGKGARIIPNATPDKFCRYFREMIRICQNRGIEYVFVFAWNEWGEGAYLEPDKRYGNRRLAYIRKILGDI